MTVKSNWLKKIHEEIYILNGGLGFLLKNTFYEDYSDNINCLRDLYKKYLNAGSDFLSYETCTLLFDLVHRDFYNPNRKILSNIRILNDLYKNFSFIKAFSIGPSGLNNTDSEKLTQALSKAYSLLKKYDHYYDLILIETQTNINETFKLIECIENIRTPIAVSFDFSNYSNAADFIDNLDFFEKKINIIGGNCGSNPIDLVDIVKELAKKTELPIIAYPSLGLPEKRNGSLSYTLPIDSYISIMEKIYTSGANILGGCCGVGPEYIQELARLFKHRKICSR